MTERPSRVNVSLMVAALVMSISLWAVVYSQNTPTKTAELNAKIELQGYDESKYAVLNRPERPIVVSVTGTEKQIEHLRDAQLLAMVDLSQAEPGVHRYPIRLFPNSLRELAADPRPTISLEVEEMKTRKIPLTVQSRGKLTDPTLVLDDTLVEPKFVTVLAPPSVLRRVAEARVELDLSRLDPTQREPAQEDINLFDERGRMIPDVRIDPPFARVTPILNPSSVQKTVFVQPKFTGSLPAGFVSPGYDVLPNQVTLVGSSDVLASLSQITTKPIDVSNAREDRIFFASLSLPNGTTAKPGMVRVRLMVRPATPAGAKP